MEGGQELEDAGKIQAVIRGSVGMLIEDVSPNRIFMEKGVSSAIR